MGKLTTRMPRALDGALVVPLVLLFSLIVSGCGGDSTPIRGSASPASTAQPGATGTTNRENSPSGDIPDNATYLVYRSQAYNVQYVEGWVQEPQPNNGIRFADKDSFVTVSLQSLPSGSMADYAHGPGTTASSSEFEQFSNSDVQSVLLPTGEAARLTFQALSAADPVTGKKVTLALDRYFIRGPHSMAVLTEATPANVDNVDGFLQIAKSFSWSSR